MLHSMQLVLLLVSSKLHDGTSCWERGRSMHAVVCNKP